MRRNKKTFSFAQVMKCWTKRIVSNFTGFEKKIVYFALKSEYDGVICGHIHQPEDKYIDNIRIISLSSLKMIRIAGKS